MHGPCNSNDMRSRRTLQLPDAVAAPKFGCSGPQCNRKIASLYPVQTPGEWITVAVLDK